MQFGFCKVKILASLVMVVCGAGKEMVNIPVVTVKNGHSLAGQALNLSHLILLFMYIVRDRLPPPPDREAIF